MVTVNISYRKIFGAARGHARSSFYMENINKNFIEISPEQRLEVLTARIQLLTEIRGQLFWHMVDDMPKVFSENPAESGDLFSYTARVQAEKQNEQNSNKIEIIDRMKDEIAKEIKRLRNQIYNKVPEDPVAPTPATTVSDRPLTKKPQ